MKIINNITEKLSDELKQDLRAGSRLSIAAACFSVYAFEELKTQLLQIDVRQPVPADDHLRTWGDPRRRLEALATRQGELQERVRRGERTLRAGAA